MKILITDGMDENGIEALRRKGFHVIAKACTPEELKEQLPQYDGIIIRSATKLHKEIIELCPNLKFIARGGVGLDNVDVEYAQSKNIQVINTPASSSRSVAELAVAHLLGLARGLHISNRNLKDSETFTVLKKQLSSRNEVADKTLLLIGFGRIGRELAKMALGLQMKVLVTDPFIAKAMVDMQINNQHFIFELPLVSKEEGLQKADFISLHSPYTGAALLDRAAFSLMKKGVYIINTSRGENIEEEALLEALHNGTVAAAALDVFQNEPTINPALLQHPQISVSPHIGASTVEAQERIAAELVEKIVAIVN